MLSLIWKKNIYIKNVNPFRKKNNVFNRCQLSATLCLVLLLFYFILLLLFFFQHLPISYQLLIWAFGFSFTIIRIMRIRKVFGDNHIVDSKKLIKLTCTKDETDFISDQNFDNESLASWKKKLNIKRVLSSNRTRLSHHLFLLPKFRIYIYISISQWELNATVWKCKIMNKNVFRMMILFFLANVRCFGLAWFGVIVYQPLQVI